MGSIYKRATSPFYYCRIKVGSRRVSRSTKQESQTAALEVAKIWQAQADLARSNSRPREIWRAVGELGRQIGIPEDTIKQWLDLEERLGTDNDLNAMAKLLTEEEQEDAQIDLRGLLASTELK